MLLLYQESGLIAWLAVPALSPIAFTTLFYDRLSPYLAAR
jgi:hypothetical protein